MIYRLRQRHRLLTRLFAVLFPLGFIAALAGRTPPPVASGTLAPEPQWFQMGEPFYGPDKTGPLELRYVADQDSAAKPILQIRALEPLKAPDVLVYWHQEDQSPVQELPTGAFLLGSLAGVTPRSFALPPSASTKPGGILLYSLAQQQVLASGPLPPYPF